MRRFKLNSHESLVVRARTAVPLLVLLTLMALLPSVNFASSAATIINESSFPWLVQGAYANYTSEVGSASAFVLQNGTVLLGVSPPGPPTLPQGGANVSLDWMVLNRTNDMAWISIAFQVAGCEYSQNEDRDHQNCTPFGFSDTQVVDANVTDGEAYLDGESVGRLNLWGPPLTTGGTLYSGTAFIGGAAYDSLANVTAYPSLNLGIRIVTPTGVDTGPYNVYRVTPALFGTGRSSIYAWENISNATFIYNGTLLTVFPMFAPSGIYDYYNGLAIQVSNPEYPINQTVCYIQDGKVEDCRVTTYSTTLGNFFRSGAAPLDLASTNIPLGANQPTPASSNSNGQSYPANVSETTLIAAFAIVASGVALSGSYLLYRRKSRRKTVFGNNWRS